MNDGGRVNVNRHGSITVDGSSGQASSFSGAAADTAAPAADVRVNRHGSIAITSPAVASPSPASPYTGVASSDYSPTVSGDAAAAALAPAADVRVNRHGSIFIDAAAGADAAGSGAGAASMYGYKTEYSQQDLARVQREQETEMQRQQDAEFLELERQMARHAQTEETRRQRELQQRVVATPLPSSTSDIDSQLDELRASERRYEERQRRLDAELARLSSERGPATSLQADGAGGGNYGVYDAGNDEADVSWEPSNTNFDSPSAGASVRVNRHGSISIAPAAAPSAVAAPATAAVASPLPLPPPPLPLQPTTQLQLFKADQRTFNWRSPGPIGPLNNNDGNNSPHTAVSARVSRRGSIHLQQTTTGENATAPHIEDAAYNLNDGIEGMLAMQAATDAKARELLHAEHQAELGRLEDEIRRVKTVAQTDKMAHMDAVNRLQDDNHRLQMQRSSTLNELRAAQDQAARSANELRAAKQQAQAAQQQAEAARQATQQKLAQQQAQQQARRAREQNEIRRLQTEVQSVTAKHTEALQELRAAQQQAQSAQQQAQSAQQQAQSAQQAQQQAQQRLVQLQTQLQAEKAREQNEIHRLQTEAQSVTAKHTEALQELRALREQAAAAWRAQQRAQQQLAQQARQAQQAEQLAQQLAQQQAQQQTQRAREQDDIQRLRAQVESITIKHTETLEDLRAARDAAAAQAANEQNNTAQAAEDAARSQRVIEELNQQLAGQLTQQGRRAGVAALAANADDAAARHVHAAARPAGRRQQGPAQGAGRAAEVLERATV